MNISILKPVSISESEKSFTNEDFVFPPLGNTDSNIKLFLLCTGVEGTPERRKLAAHLTGNSIQSFFQTFLDSNEKLNASFIEKAIRYTEIQFDEYLKEKPSTKELASNYCLLYITQEGIYLSQTGNCRICQVRNNKVIMESDQTDGSDNPNYQNALYKEIRGTNKPVKVNVNLLTDIQPGDSFLLYSDNTHSNHPTRIVTIKEVEKVNTFKQVMNSILYAFV